MALSDDLIDLGTVVALAHEGRLAQPLDLDELRHTLWGFADRADALERALEVTAEQLSPARDRAALAAGLASGKVELLAAHRVQRLPNLDQPGWTA